LVREHGLEKCVAFLGGRGDVPDLMNAADMVLHASTRPEPFGLVVLEGMILGRLVIAAALGGPLEILTDDSGWTFDPRDPSALAELLRRVVADPQISASYSRTATSKAATFSARRTATRVQDLYAVLLNGKLAHSGAIA